MNSVLFPTQLNQLQFVVRSGILLVLMAAVYVICLVPMTTENSTTFLYGLLGVYLVLKAYHLLCVMGPRLRNIGVSPIYAALSIIPLLSFVMFVGCCFAPAGSLQQAAEARPQTPQRPPNREEKVRDEY